MKEPKQTCPLIDKAIKNLAWACEEIKKEDAESAKHYLEDVRDLLEEIRTANSDLREYGNYWETYAGELEKVA
jgi:hypothetical protein